MFRALKDERSGAAWSDWEADLVAREPKAIAAAAQRLAPEIEAQKLYQFLFFRQWFALKDYCGKRNIKLVGDIPIFVAHDSADVWTHPEQFKLAPDGTPLVVAGVPPDYFSDTGQLWGNPHFNWERMQADGFSWWIDRVRATLQTFDVARIDHFRGFAASWEIPGGDKTAERGRWVEAPGRALFNAIKDALGEVPIIAEDLGVITPDVEALRDEFGFPGMRILQFAFSSDPKNTICHTTTIRTLLSIRALTTTIRQWVGFAVSPAQVPREMRNKSIVKRVLPGLSEQFGKGNPLGLHPRGPGIGSEHGDCSFAGLAWLGLGSTNESPQQHRRKLELAIRVRRTHE